MKLLSESLVSLDYRNQLQQDLARATVCRFLVAYVSAGGIDAISRGLLTRALRDPRSFGVSSLSCSCGFDPLLRLQGELPEPRLKYFMDPLVSDDGEPSTLALFHSKLVYLWLEREQKSVVYIGSHNWTRRALGPGRPRNVEASLRLDMDFAPEHLDGTGSSIASEVNRHLLQAYNLPACLPAVPANEAIFREWYDRGCRRAQSVSLQEVAIVLAVLKPAQADPSLLPWQDLVQHGIYLQALEEAEGQMVWKHSDHVLVLVWSSPTALHDARQPIILRCRATTSKAGQQSQLQGTNQSPDPVTGFRAIIFDEAQLAAMQHSTRPTRLSGSIWSGRAVELFDFEFPTQRTNSATVDGTVRPKYQFHLEVEDIAFPADSPRPEDSRLVWTRESFAVAHSRDDARYEEIPGYRVPPDLEDAIMRCLTETLLIDPERAKALPISTYDQLKAGKRVAAHPLHDTFIGEGAKRQRDEFYRMAESTSLVADLDESEEHLKGRHRGAPDQPLPRVQRVFTTPLDTLALTWAEIARRLPPRKPGTDRS